MNSTRETKASESAGSRGFWQATSIYNYFTRGWRIIRGWIVAITVWRRHLQELAIVSSGLQLTRQECSRSTNVRWRFSNWVTNYRGIPSVNPTRTPWHARDNEMINDRVTSKWSMRNTVQWTSSMESNQSGRKATTWDPLHASHPYKNLQWRQVQLRSISPDRWQGILGLIFSPWLSQACHIRTENISLGKLPKTAY